VQCSLYLLQIAQYLLSFMTVTSHCHVIELNKNRESGTQIFFTCTLCSMQNLSSVGWFLLNTKDMILFVIIILSNVDTAVN